MHNFSLIGEVLLYFILRVEVVEIQISLQIINRFGKRKGILNIKLTVGRNPAGGCARPNSHHPRPHGPAQGTWPSRTMHPSLAHQPAVTCQTPLLPGDSTPAPHTPLAAANRAVSDQASTLRGRSNAKLGARP
jgi:hypothetical protein